MIGQYKHLHNNKYAGTCTICKGHVPAQSGLVEPISGVWAVYHTRCLQKGRPETAHEKLSREGDEYAADLHDGY